MAFAPVASISCARWAICCAGGRCAGADAGDHRADDLEAVPVGEVAQAFVVGDEQPALWRDHGNLFPNPCIERLEFGDIRLGIAAIGRLACRVRLDQPVADVLDVADHVVRIQPEVGVQVAVIVVMPFVGFSTDQTL